MNKTLLIYPGNKRVTLTADDLITAPLRTSAISSGSSTFANAKFHSFRKVSTPLMRLLDCIRDAKAAGNL